MLLIISDLHLTDGSSGQTIKPGAFRIFRERVCDLAYDASWRKDGKYKPIDRIDIVLLGDILDVIRSTAWLSGNDRPWGNPRSQSFQKKVDSINKSILLHNHESLSILKDLHESSIITVPVASSAGLPQPVSREPNAKGRVPVQVDIHYMVGNHDWFYHLPGTAYNTIRKSVVKAIGLTNSPNDPFPHNPNESSTLQQLYEEHSVFARHGDIYDRFNFEGDRDASSIGDAIVVELLNRFPQQVDDQTDRDLSIACRDGLKEIDNVRPLFMIPAWIHGLLSRTCPDPKLSKKVKQIWDDMVDDFLDLQFIRDRDSFFNPNDLVDQLEWALKLSKGVTLGGLSRVMTWWSEHFGGSHDDFYKNALHERDFKNRNARFIVYGHTHRHQIIPLDSSIGVSGLINQMYLNSGTWRAVHELAQFDRKQEEFMDYYVMTYLAFFKDDERGGRSFESWSGALG